MLLNRTVKVIVLSGFWCESYGSSPSNAHNMSQMIRRLIDLGQRQPWSWSKSLKNTATTWIKGDDDLKTDCLGQLKTLPLLTGWPASVCAQDWYPWCHKQRLTMLDELMTPFKEPRLRGDWYRPDTAIRDMLQGLSDSTTFELVGVLTSASIVFYVIACPNEFSPYCTPQIANGIRHWCHYILWMLNKCEKASVRVGPKILYEHQANNDRLKEKTIYNERNPMRSRGQLATVQPYREALTLFGRKVLEEWIWWLGYRHEKTPGDGKGLHGSK